MAWEELERTRGGKFRTDPHAWYVSVGKMGPIVSIPCSHPLSRAERARVFFGRGEDAGWMMITPTTEARGRRVVVPKGSKSGYLHFSTLPGLTPGMRLAPTLVEAVSEGEDKMRIRLPWATAPVREDLTVAAPSEPAPVAPPVARPVAGGSHAANQVMIDAAVSAGNFSRVWSLEQAADYLRSRNRTCVVQIGRPTSSSGEQTVWLDSPLVILDGSEVSVNQLFKTVNGYRTARGEPSVSAPPAPKPTKQAGRRIGESFGGSGEARAPQPLPA